MAIQAPTMYQKRTAQRRRTSDITRLVQQYQQNVQATTAEYESAFGQYQKETAEKMAPFEEAMQRYQTELYPAYEEQAARYRENLASYETRLREYQASVEAAAQPTTRYLSNYSIARASGAGSQNVLYVQLAPGQRQQPYINQVQQAIKSAGLDLAPGGWGTQFYLPEDFKYEGGQVLGPGQTPDPFTERFTETLPTMPEAPVAPEISEFDASQFEARRQQLETELTREVGERKSARLAAVSRRSRRPMLQGAA